MSSLEVVRLILLVTHIVGTSAIVGAFVLQMPWRQRFDFSPMLVGSIVQIVSGCGLIAVRKFADLPVIEAKMIVKLALAVVVLVMVVIALLRQGRLRKDGLTDAGLRPLVFAVGITAIADVVVAVAWR